MGRYLKFVVNSYVFLDFKELHAPRCEKVAPNIQQNLLHACIIWVYERRHTGVQTCWGQLSPLLQVIRAQEERILGNIFYVNRCNSREILPKRWAYSFGKTHFGEGSLFSFSTLCLCNVYITFFHRECVACLHFFAPSWPFYLFSFVKTCSFFHLHTNSTDFRLVFQRRPTALCLFWVISVIS